MVHYLSLLTVSLIQLLSLSQALPIDQPQHLQHEKRFIPGKIVYCDNPEDVALTFDDGPADYTEGLIDYLAEQRVKATFFVNGYNYWKDDDQNRIARILKKAYDNGLEIGSHTYSHIDLTKASDQKIFEEIHNNENMIYGAIKQYPALIRPPYGNTNDHVTKMLNRYGYTVVDWSIDIGDANNNPSPVSEQVEFVESEIKNDQSVGHIILSHDAKELTATQFAQKVIPTLRKLNLNIVTVSDCLGTNAYKNAASSRDDYMGENNAQYTADNNKLENSTTEVQDIADDSTEVQDTDTTTQDTDATTQDTDATTQDTDATTQDTDATTQDVDNNTQG
ncbi:hypothetical protein BJ944DRAFT_193770 [Cunninghamella echinulata]|nr:hypothetical protein BJ944DRAFT_193770 [Cunninghamella echinulata]